MTAPDLTALADKLDELAMKATPLPWSFAPAVPGAKRYFCIAGNNAAHNRQVDIGTLQGGYFSCEANAAILDNLVNNLPTLTTALREAARLREVEAERIGPRPHVLVCKGCPAYETETWREPSGDGETYDNGQYAWCNAAGRRSMGAYHYDHNAAPSWCPGRAALESPRG